MEINGDSKMEKIITVYTTTHWPYCTMLKDFLAQNNTP